LNSKRYTPYLQNECRFFVLGIKTRDKAIAVDCQREPERARFVSKTVGIAVPLNAKTRLRSSVKRGVGECPVWLQGEERRG